MATPDAAEREAVRSELGTTLFLEAGAGSGKTSSLVDRFVALVASGVPADRIAAVTFTERAADDLAQRIRRALAEAEDHVALAQLDRAAIGTLHAFAARVLNEHPVEAGLPPKLEVLDEIASQVAFEDRWSTFVDQLLEDTSIEGPFRLLLASGVKLRHLRDMALAFADNWDLVSERLGDREAMSPLEVDHLLEELEDVLTWGDGCRHGDDRLLARLGELASWGQEIGTATDDDTKLELLCALPSTRVSTTGQAANWPDIRAARAAVAALGEGCERLRLEVQHEALGHLADAIGRFTVDSAQARQRAGQLEFHDLLVLARAVLQDPEHGPAVRTAVRGRYRCLLLDEFQDTDPIQVELATLVAAPPGVDVPDWRSATVEPGRLFFVGDPKQSIYRFRRADVGVFLAARAHLAGSVHQLTTNFRTTAPVLGWVNHTFSRLIVEEPGSQPAYQALHAVRQEPAPAGPSVALLGAEAQPSGITADELREAEAASVAATARRAIAEGWSVADSGGWRGARWRDVAILVPARTSLRQLERALEDGGVPYRVETSSLVYGTREVRDLLMVARAVEDPTDSLAVVTALRTPAFGCGDDDLYTWRVVHGRWWDHQAPPPEDALADHPVARALAWLGDLHRERVWLAPSEVLDRIVRERRLMELAFVHARPRDLWRRLRFVVDQARAWEDDGGTTLREYLAWVRLQAAEGSRVLESVLPETDDDAVRILTVHGAKGLEFPITILSGLTTQLRARPAGVQVRFPPGGDWALKVGADVRTQEFEATVAVEEQMDRHERLRLLYVAATRARDHLVVSVHRKRARPNGKVADTAAQVLWDAGGDGPGVVLDPPAGEAVLERRVAADPESGPELVPRDVWEAERSAALGAAGRPLATSATALAKAVARSADAGDPGLAKGARDLDLPPWQKGRYGTSVGRAVHGVLQTVDLSSGDGLNAAASAQAAGEGVPGREGVIAALARSALASPLVRRAAGRPHWREVYVGCPLGDGVLEGFVDLLYRDDDGLVVVDYKTDAWRGEADLDAKVERYRVQLAAYVYGVAQVTGEPVVRAELLFLAPAGAVERAVEATSVDVEALAAAALP